MSELVSGEAALQLSFPGWTKKEIYYLNRSFPIVLALYKISEKKSYC